MSMSMSGRNFAIQIAGGCIYTCPWCSTGLANASGKGVVRDTKNNSTAIFEKIEQLNIGNNDHVHITGTGEPGISRAYKPLLDELSKRGSKISVCCGGPTSIPDTNLNGSFYRADISLNDYTDPIEAIKKAKEIGAIVVVTKVDADGSLSNIDPKDIAKNVNADGALIRSLRTIGLAGGKNASGKTRWWVDESVIDKIQPFPSACFPEFKDLSGTPSILCIDQNGETVDYLGLPKEENKDLSELVTLL